jgi:hypothetical protein
MFVISFLPLLLALSLLRGLDKEKNKKGKGRGKIFLQKKEFTLRDSDGSDESLK